LTGAQSASTEQDYGYQEFMDTVDTIVLGRNTFELVLTFDSWPYGGKKVVVLSSRSDAVPPHLVDDFEWLSLPPQRLVERLSAQGATHLYVDGGKTIQGNLVELKVGAVRITYEAQHLEKLAYEGVASRGFRALRPGRLAGQLGLEWHPSAPQHARACSAR